jgi:hypothetical protein
LAIASGIGNKKIRKENGKTMSLIHVRPRKRNPPAVSKLTKERAMRVR